MMETVLFLFPQLNLSAPKEEPYYKIVKPGDTQVIKQENKNNMKEKKNRLSLLLQKSEYKENVSKSAENVKPISVLPEEAFTWGESFRKLLSHKDGIEVFSVFLKTEYSQENIEFWLACEEYKKTKSTGKLASKAKKIYLEFIEAEALKEVNLDFLTKEITKENILHPTLSSFDLAQTKIYNLMEKDSYPRFLKSNIYLDLIRQTQSSNIPFRKRSRSFTFNDFKEAKSDFTIWL
ncbi:regulator of G-protein signaling 18 [Latimeria chalumnae]|uniref:Regulator of G protein signaling 18 n=1 Tax=Latimeria chalumnae TaxID=7897 RepID=H3AKS3_LATCH|nr:PREDICTED: regulator of G-protein signaling 18 [Latimeria chalumnae]|eukprot:XP_006007574.1 PREDICTED: regulator of G-protein signaling 18 [Latimeria chalumnae]